MSKILDRYASAVHSTNLSSEERTTFSDSDVLGAAGLAGKRHGLSVALQRMLDGDYRATHDVAREMAELVWSKAHAMDAKLKRTQALDLAKAVLAWYRHGTCKKCHGHGYQLIKGTRTIGESECPACIGGKIPFDKQFPDPEKLLLARWLQSVVDHEMSKAGPATMAKLAPKLDL